MVRVPAIALMVLSFMYLFAVGYHLGVSDWWRGGNLVNSINILTSSPETTHPMDVVSSEKKGEIIGYIAADILMPFYQLIIFIGAISMLRLRDRGWAKTAAVFSVIPLCSPCFVVGIPFGIWALIVLKKPEVKAAFN